MIQSYDVPLGSISLLNATKRGLCVSSHLSIRSKGLAYSYFPRFALKRRPREPILSRGRGRLSTNHYSLATSLRNLLGCRLGKLVRMNCDRLIQLA